MRGGPLLLGHLKTTTHQPPQQWKSQLQSLPIRTLNDLGRWPQDEDVDDIMKDLVSPAPESFLVINATVAKLNSCNGDSDVVQSYILDLGSLSQTLVKPGRLLHVRREEHYWKWKTRTNNDGNDDDVKLSCMDCDSTIAMDKVQAQLQLYRTYTTLELAHMAARGQSSAPTPDTFSVENVVFQMEVRKVFISLLPSLHYYCMP